MESTQENLAAGLRHHQAGRWQEAEKSYLELLQIEPDHPDAMHLLGVLAFQRGRQRQAIEHIERAIAIRPGTAEYHNNLAAAYRADGQLDRAVENYRRALEIKPGYSDAHNNLGNVLQQRGEANAARASYRRAMELNPDSQFASSSLAAMGDQGLDADTGQRGREHSQPANGNVCHAAGAPQTVLHVGCGPANPENLHERFRRRDWKELRLDINPAVKPDVVASLTDMRDVESESVDAVWSSHNLEHLYSHEVPLALAEFARVLAADGFALITLPDLQQIAEFISADKLEDVIYHSPAGPITPRDCLFGLDRAIAGGNEYMAHRTGFTATSLERHLREAGFAEVTVWFAPFALWAEARKASRAA